MISKQNMFSVIGFTQPWGIFFTIPKNIKSAKNAGLYSIPLRASSSINSKLLVLLFYEFDLHFQQQAMSEYNKQPIGIRHFD